MFKFKFNDTAKHRVDYGTLKNISATNENDTDKFLEAIYLGIFKHFEDNDYLLELMVYSINHTWNLCGEVQPMKLMRNDVKFDIETSGPMEGLEYVTLLLVKHEDNFLCGMICQ